MRVAIHELKRGLSRYLSLAREGRMIEVTSHNKPVARIVGVPSHTPEGLSRLLRIGAVEWGGGKPSFEVPVRLPDDGKPLSEMIREDRG